MIANELKEQLRGYLAQLEGKYTLHAEYDPQHPKGLEMLEFVEGVAECSPNIDHVVKEGDGLTLTILKDGEPRGVVFRAIPGGHEFTSFILAILNLDGKGKNIPDETVLKRIEALRGPINLTTYMLLSCGNCPDVVQSLNLMAIYNREITHTSVDVVVFMTKRMIWAYNLCRQSIAMVSCSMLTQECCRVAQRVGS